MGEDDSARNGRYAQRMQRIGSLFILLIGVFLPSSANGQLVAERVEGISRICSYGNYLNIPSVGAASREYRVGMAQNCPAVLPGNDPSIPAPPTAQLSLESVGAGSRTCVYQQAGAQWTFQIRSERPCPLNAGMIAPRDQPPARQSWPSADRR
jgi:hypothetical protein